MPQAPAKKSPAKSPSSSPPPPPAGIRRAADVAAPPRSPLQFWKLPLTDVPLRDITHDDANHRIPGKADKAAIEQLADSLKANGLMQPILLHPDPSGNPKRWHLVFGFNRRSAAELLGWKSIPAFCMQHVPDEAERQQLRAIENLHRKDLNPAEEAIAVIKNVEANAGNIERVAAALGRPAKWVSDRYYLAGLSQKVRDHLAAGRLNLGQARELVKVSDQRQQEGVAGDIIEDFEAGTMTSIEELRRRVEDLRRPLASAAWQLDVGFAGKPACTACPCNTANNLTLFGVEKKNAEPRCTFEQCYQVKVEASGKMQRDAAAKVISQVKAEKMHAESARTIAAAREVTPPALKPEAVKAQIAAQLPAAGSKPGAAGRDDAGTSRPARAKPEAPKGPSETERRQLAVIEWSAAFQSWRENGNRAIVKAVSLGENALRNLTLLALSHCPLLETHEAYPLARHMLDFGGGNSGKLRGATAPAIEDPPSPKLARLIELAGKPTSEDEELHEFAELASAIEINFIEIAAHAGPELLLRIAKAFDVSLPPPPDFNEYLPADLRKKYLPRLGDLVEVNGLVGQVLGTSCIDGVELVHVKLPTGNQIAWACKDVKQPTPEALERYHRELHTPAAPGRCRVCGCTEDNACEGGCTWADAEELLCDRCVQLELIAPGEYTTERLSINADDVDAANSGPDIKANGLIKEVIFAKGTIALAIVNNIPGPTRSWAAVQLIPASRWTGGEPLIPTSRFGKKAIDAGNYLGLRVETDAANVEYVMTDRMIQISAPAKSGGGTVK